MKCAIPPAGRITLMFTDIADSSRMTRALGDGVYLRTMREPHCQRIRAAIAEHEGFEVKTGGDSFMIAFAAAELGDSSQNQLAAIRFRNSFSLRRAVCD